MSCRRLVHVPLVGLQLFHKGPETAKDVVNEPRRRAVSTQLCARLLGNEGILVHVRKRFSCYIDEARKGGDLSSSSCDCVVFCAGRQRNSCSAVMLSDAFEHLHRLINREVSKE